MAFLDATPDVVGPDMQIQREDLVRGYGLVAVEVGYRQRTVYEYRLMWPVDDTGGETIPDTYLTTYLLMSVSRNIGYAQPSGVLIAIYQLEGEWSTVWTGVITSI